MITLLFEDDLLLKETSFSSDLVYHSNLKLLKRKCKDICLDVKLQNPDMLLISLSTSAENILGKVKSIREKNENVKIILLVDFCSEYHFWIAKKFEINGVIKKDINSEEFYSKLMSIVDDFNTSSYPEAEQLIDFAQIGNSLTNSEKRVFKLIGEGLTTKEISALLNVSHRTVDNHRAKILNKLCCKSASKLIYIASIYNLFKLL